MLSWPILSADVCVSSISPDDGVALTVGFSVSGITTVYLNVPFPVFPAASVTTHLYDRPL